MRMVLGKCVLYCCVIVAAASVQPQRVTQLLTQLLTQFVVGSCCSLLQLDTVLATARWCMKVLMVLVLKKEILMKLCKLEW